MEPGDQSRSQGINKSSSKPLSCPPGIFIPARLLLLLLMVELCHPCWSRSSTVEFLSGITCRLLTGVAPLLPSPAEQGLCSRVLVADPCPCPPHKGRTSSLGIGAPALLLELPGNGRWGHSWLLLRAPVVSPSCSCFGRPAVPPLPFPVPTRLFPPSLSHLIPSCPFQPLQFPCPPMKRQILGVSVPG